MKQLWTSFDTKKKSFSFNLQSVHCVIANIEMLPLQMVETRFEGGADRIDVPPLAQSQSFAGQSDTDGLSRYPALRASLHSSALIWSPPLFGPACHFKQAMPQRGRRMFAQLSSFTPTSGHPGVLLASHKRGAGLASAHLAHLHRAQSDVQVGEWRRMESLAVWPQPTLDILWQGETLSGCICP